MMILQPTLDDGTGPDPSANRSAPRPPPAPAPAPVNPFQARFVLWAVFHQYMDQLHFTGQHVNRTGGELKFLMGNNSYRKLLQAAGLITTTTSASEPRLFAVERDSDTQGSASHAANVDELTMASAPAVRFWHARPARAASQSQRTTGEDQI